MGQFGSTAKKCEVPSKETVPKETASVTNNADLFLRKYGRILREKGFVPDFLLVREAPSSQFIDEDGDIAHEFYAEKIDGNLRKLTRVVSNLRPKGKERHEIPRLSPDLPVVMLELPQSS